MSERYTFHGRCQDCGATIEVRELRKVHDAFHDRIDRLLAVLVQRDREDMEASEPESLSCAVCGEPVRRVFGAVMPCLRAHLRTASLTPPKPEPRVCAVCGGPEGFHSPRMHNHAFTLTPPEPTTAGSQDKRFIGIITMIDNPYGPLFEYTVYAKDGNEGSAGTGTTVFGVLDMLVEGVQAYYGPTPEPSKPDPLIGGGSPIGSGEVVVIDTTLKPDDFEGEQA